jgi:hypothetical protein
VNTDKAESDGDVLSAGFLLDYVQHFERDGLRARDVCAGGGAQSELKLARVHARENLRAELPANQNNDQSCRDQISAHDEPASAHGSLQRAFV